MLKTLSVHIDYARCVCLMHIKTIIGDHFKLVKFKDPKPFVHIYLTLCESMYCRSYLANKYGDSHKFKCMQKKT